MKTSGLILVLLASAVLLAQDKESNTSADTKPQLPALKTTVVVTATRLETEVEKVPASVSVIPESELKARNTTLIDQSLNLLPGVILSRTKGPMDSMPAVTMRGFGGAGVAQSRVLVLLDGEPINDAYTGQVMWTTIPVNEIDRVEVVRGPFSALYGGNAMGGVVNVLTRPVRARHLETDSQFGSFNTGQYSVNYSDRFWDKLGASFGYQRLQTVGYPSTFVTKTSSTGSSGTTVTGLIPTQTSSGTPTFQIGDSGHNWFNQDAWRGRVEYTFSPKTTAFFQYIRQQWNYGYGQYNTLLRDAAGNPVSNGNVTFDNAGTPNKMTLTPLSFLPGGPGGGANNFYQVRVLHQLTTKQSLQISGGVMDQPTTWYNTPTTGAISGSGPGTYSNTTSRSWHANVFWSWDKSTRHKIIIGNEFRRENAGSVNFNMTNWTQRGSITSQYYAAQGVGYTEAVYAQDQIKITNRLNLIAGGRVDYWRTTDGGANSFGTIPTVSYPERSSTSPNGKLSGIYQATSSLSLRASVGTAFRNPTVYNLYRTWQSSTGTLYVANPNLEPETMVSWEFGARQRIGRNFQLNGTYFENRVKNLIYSETDYVSDPTGHTIISLNAGKARIRGAELEGKQQLRRWLQLTGSYTFTDAIITENSAVPASVGKEVTRVPRHAAGAMLLAARGRWSGTVSERYVARVYSTDQNTEKVWGVPGSYDGYLLTAMSFSYDVNKRVTLHGSIDNLFDRRYFQYYLAPGRTILGGVRFHVLDGTWSRK